MADQPVTARQVIERLTSVGVNLYPWQESALKRLFDGGPVTSCARPEDVPRLWWRPIPYVRIKDTWEARCPDCGHVAMLWARYMQPLIADYHYCTVKEKVSGA